MKVLQKSVELSIVTSNMEHRRDDAGVIADIKYVLNTFKPDIWGAQECEGYIDLLRKNATGYKLALPDNPLATEKQNPIMYRDDTLRLVSAGARKIHDGKAGEYPARYVNWAHFHDRNDGNSIWYYNTHLNSHIEVSGHPRNLPRVPLSTAHLQMLAQMVSNHTVGKNIVFWGGDLNIDEDADNKVNWGGFANAIFHKARLQSVYDELHTPSSFDTHDSRKIDVIGSHMDDGRVKAKSVQRSGQRGSDHRFVKAIFVVQRLNPGKPPVDPKVPDAIDDVDGDGTPNTGGILDRPDDSKDAVPTDTAIEWTPAAAPQVVDPGFAKDHSSCCRGKSIE